MVSVVVYLAFLGALAAERLFELWLSRRHARALVAQGGYEVGAAHFRAMSLLHGSFFAACALEVLLLHRPFPGPLGWGALAMALAAQGLRYWAIATLGVRWNVRIVVLPGAPPVTSGPYRLVRHPNYVAVILELLFVPLVHGAWLTAIGFSLANAWMLRVRIAAEERALGDAYAHAFAHKPRFVPKSSTQGSPS
jgi:methyltransferase